ncbi:hypothetical protein HYH02_009341 [Chlamydomonas schloesseri]|uniref:Uncharacterized protein n=1 Tax=Chlamydomonas schloesseri TaxID=2026947 RepID=A0A835TGT7_9CHLO|nr:hypothetical protein HYH02_009341 [Chlamydomonas schloesseri]|eukprot:KAG2443268.1 hypothetical protein HYH02_009341 [Chlamydomonas schloesseri]
MQPLPLAQPSHLISSGPGGGGCGGANGGMPASCWEASAVASVPPAAEELFRQHQQPHQLLMQYGRQDEQGHQLKVQKGQQQHGLLLAERQGGEEGWKQQQPVAAGAAVASAGAHVTPCSTVATSVSPVATVRLVCRAHNGAATRGTKKHTHPVLLLQDAPAPETSSSSPQVMGLAGLINTTGATRGARHGPGQPLEQLQQQATSPFVSAAAPTGDASPYTSLQSSCNPTPGACSTANSCKDLIGRATTPVGYLQLQHHHHYKAQIQNQHLLPQTRQQLLAAEALDEAEASAPLLRMQLPPRP